MTTVIIPAAGDGTRFDGDGPKQLLDINGEPLIKRLVRQLKERDHRAVVLTHNEMITTALRYDCPIYWPAMSRYLIETIYHAPIMWTSFERHVVLLGDCVFSDDALDTIFEDPAAPMFYGDWGEIFAFAFVPDHTRGWLQKAIKISEEHEGWGPAGKLWMLYRLMSNLSIYEHDEIRARFFTWITDYTTDFDTMEEYTRFSRHITNGELIK